MTSFHLVEAEIIMLLLLVLVLFLCVVLLRSAATNARTLVIASSLAIVPAPRPTAPLLSRAGAATSWT